MVDYIRRSMHTKDDTTINRATTLLDIVIFLEYCVSMKFAFVLYFLESSCH